MGTPSSSVHLPDLGAVQSLQALMQTGVRTVPQEGKQVLDLRHDDRCLPNLAVDPVEQVVPDLAVDMMDVASIGACTNWVALRNMPPRPPRLKVRSPDIVHSNPGRMLARILG